MTAEPDLAALARQFEGLKAYVARLGALVQRQPVSTAFPLPRWNWSGLGSEARRSAWEELERWVSDTVDTYDLADAWPTCWARHSDVVAWTLALRTWHRAVYAPELERAAGTETPTLTPTTPRAYWEWHTHGLIPFLVRLGDMVKGCSGGTAHTPVSELIRGQRAERREIAHRRFTEHLDVVCPATDVGNGGVGE